MLAAADEAGAIALRHYGSAGFDIKSDGSVVTAADREVEAFLQARLGEIMPDAGYIGEETVADAAAIDACRRNPWIWVVDPIDGTAAFTDGLDTFCISVGLFSKGRPYAGAVFFPALGHRYSAVRGEGAEYDGVPIKVLDAAPVPDLAAIYVDARTHLECRMTFDWKLRCFGSAALHYLLVARGVAVGAVSRAHVWDYAGAAAVLEEAGGIVRYLGGGAIDWLEILDGRTVPDQVLGAPPALWQTAAATIQPIS